MRGRFSNLGPDRNECYSGLILDGVTGAGKSTLLAMLPKVLAIPPVWECDEIFMEEQTCGEFWDELRDNPESSDEYKTRMLATVVARVELAYNNRARYHYILERAHYSLYAALSEWRLYESLNARLARCNPVAILLDLSNEALPKRSIDRKDRPWVRGQFMQLYGSDRNVLEAMRVSQDRRKEGLSLSRIPYHIIDTSHEDWDAYAAEIKQILMMGQGST